MAIITVSRGSASGGQALAERVAERLQHRILGRELLVEAARKLGVSEEDLSRSFDRSPGLLDRLTSGRRLYLAAVQATLAEHAVAGNLVYHGNVGHLLLRPVRCVLRVRLIVPLEARAQALMERRRLTREAALAYIQKVDAERMRWARFMYGVDWTDPSLYDVTVNMERTSIETASALIAEAAARPEFMVTESEARGLADFLLGCRVRLALASNPPTRGIGFDVRAVGGTVKICGELMTSGTVASAGSRARAELTEVVARVPGVQRVVLNVQQVDPYR